MKINIASVLKNEGASMNFSGSVELGKTKFMGSTLDFEKPLEVVGNVLNIGGTIEIRAEIKGSYVTQCSRCGDDVRESLFAELFESIAGDFSDADEECVSIQGTVMDIGGAVDACIFNSIPLQFLCSEECKGLCHVCGINLNKNKCNCEDEVYDPRFAIFRNLSKEV
ncbi:MAG: DUF177 domain-containing protein [Clostridia bacterium]|nr:DUF177 domain-containing protein [Clostridia bacterium]MBQ6937889.1 DUF177 domain-containing protein [Clostridia bacterium]